MYVIVMGYAMVVAVIGLSALTMTRIERRYSEGTADFAEARFYAQSAVEMGLSRIDSDPDWRNTYPNGVWEADRSIGSGTYTLEGVDPDDGDLTDSNTDPLVLTGTGVTGDARYKLKVTLVADVPPLGCLQTALHAGNNIAFLDAIVQGDHIISANNTVQTTGACAVNADVEAVNGISGGGYNGTTTTGVAPRTMPGAAAFDYYLASGTPINLASIPGGQIADILLSPAVNPYGAQTNPEGIYVVDCMSTTIVVRECRIVGTLVLLDPGGGSKIATSVNLSAAVGNYPSLLVRGDIEIVLGQVPLQESLAGVNFNPPGTPYQGITDGDVTDSYPSQIGGLVYVSGALSITAEAAFDGVLVVGGDLTATTTLELTYQSTFINSPPPGFTEPPRMVISPGTWRQAVD
jgi:hypothetical protein